MFNEQRQPALPLIVINRGAEGEPCSARQEFGVAKEDAIEPPAVQLQTKLQVPVLDEPLLDDIELLREQWRRESLAPDVLFAGLDESKREFAGFESAIRRNGAVEDRAVA